MFAWLGLGSRLGPPFSGLLWASRCRRLELRCLGCSVVVSPLVLGVKTDGGDSWVLYSVEGDSEDKAIHYGF